MRHGMWFVGVVFLLTWALDLVLFLRGGMSNPVLFQVLAGLQMLIPGAVALVFRRWVSKEGFGSSGLGLGRKRYYLVGSALILGWLAASFLLSAATPWLRFDTHLDKAHAILSQIAQQTGKPVPLGDGAFLGVMAIQTVLVGAMLGLPAYFGEEYGWRAYLLPKLLVIGKWPAILLHGAIWGLWHAPVIAMGHNYPGHPVLGILWMTALCVLLGAVFAWLFYASGSVWVVSLAHGLVNQGSGYAMAFLVATTLPLLAGPVGLVGMGLMAAIVLALHLGKRFAVVGTAALR